MSPFFQPEEDALPPENVRFTQVCVQPWEDCKRVRVQIGLTPFQKPPDISIAILQNEEEICQASIIEVIETDFSFTMHLRSPLPGAEYHCLARITYADLGQVDERSAVFSLPDIPASN